LSENYPIPGRNSFATWTIFVRRLVPPLDGERVTLAKQALPLKGTRGSVLRVLLRAMLRHLLRVMLRSVANAGASRVASRVASFGDSSLHTADATV
jgi:hypothetical protein